MITNAMQPFHPAFRRDRIRVVSFSLRIVFMGSPEFALPCLKALLDSGRNVVAAYTQPDRPSGRGREAAGPPVKRLAVERGIAVFQPASLRDPSAQAALAALSPELIVVAAYGLILPRAVLEMPRWGCVNVHPSLLPRHRGASPIPWAILEGDAMTGVTMMLMDVGLDTGAILEQEEEPISDEDNAHALSDRLAGLAAGMLPGTIDRRVAGQITARPQDEACATYSRLIAKEDGEIDWNLPAVRLWRRVRAFQPWPGCYAWLHGRMLKIKEAVPVNGSIEPGMIVELPAGSPGGSVVGVGTGEGILGLVRVQVEGKKEVAAAEFIRGQRDFIGSSLLAAKNPQC